MNKLSTGIIGGVLTACALGIIGWAYNVGKEDGEKEMIDGLTTMAIIVDSVEKEE